MDPNIAFIFPVALELLASCLLIIYKWGTGKRHLLLAAEGSIYFVLATIEFLSNISLLSGDNADRFRSFDIGIGIASFLPLLFYTLYLYLFTRMELLTNLPKYVINVATVSLFLSLPVIIAMNEVASLVGLAISFGPTGFIPSLTFSSKHDEWLWLFFAAFTLAILTAYQATVFTFSLFRLIWILVQKYRQKHLIRVRGIGWISAGVKLGALESILGFAGGGFEFSMTRRILRFMGRACLCIGLVVGVDPVTEATPHSYDNLERPEKLDSKLRRSQLVTSHSSFQELSAMPTFQSTLLSGISRPMQIPSPTTARFKNPHYLTFTQRQRLMHNENSDYLERLQVPEMKAGDRVTVFYDNQGGPPLLQMRFSALEVALVPENGKGDEIALPTKDITAESTQIPSPFDTDDDLPVPKPPFTQNRKSRSSAGSASSFTPSVVEIVNVPRRTISQRRAQARVILARKGDQAENHQSQDAGISDGEISDSTNNEVSRPYRVSTPGPSISMSGSSSRKAVEAHTHAPSLSISEKSVADSLQAVQELTSQFPSLPPSASFDLSVNWPTSAERTCTPNFDGGFVVHAIGSPTDLAVGHISPPPSPLALELCEEDIALTARRGYERCRTPTSIHSGYSIRTIKPSIPFSNRDTAHLEQFRQSVDLEEGGTKSEWAADPFDDPSFLLATGPKPIDDPTKHLSPGYASVGPNLRPIVIPRRGKNSWRNGLHE